MAIHQLSIQQPSHYTSWAVPVTKLYVQLLIHKKCYCRCLIIRFMVISLSSAHFAKVIELNFRGWGTPKTDSGSPSRRHQRLKRGEAGSRCWMLCAEPDQLFAAAPCHWWCKLSVLSVWRGVWRASLRPHAMFRLSSGTAPVRLTFVRRQSCPWWAICLD